MLAGAMRELQVGDPRILATDIGPVIDGDALAKLETHVERMSREGRLVAVAPCAAETVNGTFLAPRLYESDSLAVLPGEVFGPILHLVRYRAGELDPVIG